MKRLLRLLPFHALPQAASQFPFPYAGQIMGPLARDGPRLKAVIVSAPEAVVDLFKNIGRNSGADNQSLRAQCPPWLGFELLRVALGGQVRGPPLRHE